MYPVNEDVLLHLNVNLDSSSFEYVVPLTCISAGLQMN